VGGGRRDRAGAAGRRVVPPVALVLNDAPEEPQLAATASLPRARPAATPAPAGPAVQPPAPAVESSRAAQPHHTAALTGPGAHHSLAVVPAPRELPVHALVGDRSPAARPEQETDPRVERLATQLRGGAHLTGASVAKQLGCSPRTGRRLLRQAEDHVASTTSARKSGTG
jgi:hypothetical protein